MQRKLILTNDGSSSVAVPDMNVTYHSVHGAVQESEHVFLQAGFRTLKAGPSPVRIFEMGFGTGLNALLTFKEAFENQVNVFYETVELHPLTADEYLNLNYCDHLRRPDLKPFFERMHSPEWDKEIIVSETFILKKRRMDVLDFSAEHSFDLVYYDAFAPNAQPELWTTQAFAKMFSILKKGGILVTYCSKGEARRAMQSAGFKVEKLPGPIGKKEIVRCTA